MQPELFVSMAVSAWKAQNKKVDDLIEQFTDDQWNKDTAYGKNSGVYLLGHLAAVNDNMLVLLDFGERLHPELEEPFLKNPDKSGLPAASLADLKKYWKEINHKLEKHMKGMSPEDWFAAHTAVSPEDFLKEPHRNKLNIIINRTNHQSYHLGQLVYLK